MNALVVTNSISPHTAPLAVSLSAKLGKGHVSYMVSQAPEDIFRTKQVVDTISNLLVDKVRDLSHANLALQQADVVLENQREFVEINALLTAGKTVCYMSERWFKPVRIDAPCDSEHAPGRGWYISGFWRMLCPFVWKRTMQMMRLMRAKNRFLYLPTGIVAARDMARMCGLLNCDWRCLFRAPKLNFESKPGGRITAVDGKDKIYCLDHMRMWGYFVAPSQYSSTSHLPPSTSARTKRVLWVGRMFGWKRLDTLIKAVGGVAGLELDIYGNGPDEKRVRQLASRHANVHVYDSVLLSDVRRLMREHDVYVLASTEFEGWGAVINEALEEGMCVIGTYEAGACATILPVSNLFHVGDWKALRAKLLSDIATVSIGAWTADNAANVLLKIAENLKL